jgi:hypothetical protein
VIAQNCDHPPAEAEKLVRALVLIGWLEVHTKYRLIVHDWKDHAPRYVHKYLKENKIRFKTQRCRGSDPVATQDILSCSPVAPTKPNQTQPNPTKPNQHKQTSSAAPTFWTAFPKKVGKKAAEKAWKNAKDKPDIEVILKAIGNQVAEKARLAASKEFCPPWKHPATWLNQGCWSDECGPAAARDRTQEIWEARAAAFARIKPGMVAVGPEGNGQVDRVTSISVFVKMDDGGGREITDLGTFRHWQFKDRA